VLGREQINQVSIHVDCAARSKPAVQIGGSGAERDQASVAICEF
jgi:hypothetical protein